MQKKSRKLKENVISRSVEYVIVALGLVAGLAWNEAIKDLINYFFPLDANSILAKFIYAVIITGVVVVISVNLIRVSKKDKSSEE